MKTITFAGKKWKDAGDCYIRLNRPGSKRQKNTCFFSNEGSRFNSACGGGVMKVRRGLGVGREDNKKQVPLMRKKTIWGKTGDQ